MIVSVLVAVTVRCDETGCASTATTFKGRKQKLALQAARSGGWYVKGERCLCPEHKRTRKENLRRLREPTSY